MFNQGAVEPPNSRVDERKVELSAAHFRFGMCVPESIEVNLTCNSKIGGTEKNSAREKTFCEPFPWTPSTTDVKMTHKGDAHVVGFCSFSLPRSIATCSSC